MDRSVHKSGQRDEYKYWSANMAYKVLDVQWHLGHQYEMLKFPFVRWTWLLHYKRPTIDPSIRGHLDSWLNYATHYEPGLYDAAILHLDQDCLHPHSWARGKGAVYRELNAAIKDIPKIVLMHGTPHCDEAPAPYCHGEWLISRLARILGDNILVVNSHEAARQWKRGLPVIHGMDPGEWYDLPKVPRVTTVISRGGMNSYYDREFLGAVRTELRRRDITHCHVGVDVTPRSWQEYRQLLGSSLIYFNPTRESPMPRARTEAMLSGCCVITTPHHDADTFVQHEVNGILVERNAEEVANLVEHLFRNPDQAVMMGAQGKITAQDRFNWNRFAGQWQALLESVTQK
jgi:hypothetical protein